MSVPDNSATGHKLPIGGHKRRNLAAFQAQRAA